MWDLCLLAGWQQLQPALAAAIISLKSGMLGCTDAPAARAYLLQNAAQLSVAQLQHTLEEHFMPAIRADVQAPSHTYAHKLAGAVLKKTQGGDTTDSTQ